MNGPRLPHATRPSPNASNEPPAVGKRSAPSTGGGGERPEPRISMLSPRTAKLFRVLDPNAGKQPDAYHGPRTEYTPNCVVSLGWLGTGRNKRR